MRMRRRRKRAGMWRSRGGRAAPATGHRHPTRLAGMVRTTSGGIVAERMKKVLEEIQDGTFAKEWSGAQETAGETLDKVKAARDQMPIAKWEQSARRAFGIAAARDGD